MGDTWSRRKITLQTPNKSCRSLEGFNVHVVVVNRESQDTGCSLQSGVPRREEPCRAVPCLNLVSASDCLTITYDVVFDTWTGNDTT